jgi:signal transduction histidine kinase
VEADPARVEQALANLVENALEHGAGEIDLFAVERDDVVELHVADRGAGFPPGFLERAFDRFSRADDARSGGGSGLGLSIVALIGEAHGGSAGAANRPEGGADVWLVLPRARAGLAAEALI